MAYNIQQKTQRHNSKGQQRNKNPNPQQNLNLFKTVELNVTGYKFCMFFKETGEIKNWCTLELETLTQTQVQ